MKKLTQLARRTAISLAVLTLTLGGCMKNQTQESTSEPRPVETRSTTEATTAETTTETTTMSTEPTTPDTEADKGEGFVPVEEIDKEEQIYFYRNPSRINSIGDPFIIRDAETGSYTLIATSASIGYYGWNSDDLVNWGTRKFVYERPDNAWSTDSYWAPEVIHYKDKYYMFYTARDQRGTLLISVAIADKAEGPYVDATDKATFDPGFAIIDASVLVDDDGQPYFYFTKDCSENQVNGQNVSEIYGVKLAPDLLSMDGEPVLLTRPDQAWENPTGEWVWNEGPIVLKHKDLYYLAYSANFFESPAYSVGYATSKSPLGPFTKSESNPVLHAGRLEGISGSGHHSYINSPDGTELFTVYHTHTVPQAPSGNRQMSMDRMLFTPDGDMIMNGPTMCWLPVPANDTVRTLTAEDIDTTDQPQLFDGILAIHPSDKDRQISLTPTDGQATVDIKLKAPHTLEALSIIAGATPSNIQQVQVTFGDQTYDLGALDNKDPLTHALAGRLPATDTDTLRFTFHAEDPEAPMTLSEIYLIETR